MSSLIMNLTNDVSFNMNRLKELDEFLVKQAAQAKLGFKSTLPEEQLRLLCGEQVMRRELVAILSRRLEYAKSLVV